MINNSLTGELEVESRQLFNLLSMSVLTRYSVGSINLIFVVLSLETRMVDGIARSI